MTSILNFRLECNDNLNKIEQTITRIQIILSTAMESKLSQMLINEEELSKLIRNINAKTRELTPVFPLDKIEEYYKIKSSDVKKGESTIIIYTRIPLINTDHN